MDRDDTVGVLFSRKPHQWGLRGDPYLWEAMQKRLSSIRMPGTEAELTRIIEEAFQSLSGHSILEDEDFFVEQFAHGGMSSGHISPDFWRNVALPLLTKHYKEMARFTLQRGRWYAAELIGEEFEEAIRSYSPIKVLSFEPLKTGARQFELEFYHANYPEGVREKIYTMKMLDRGSHYLLAKSTTHKPARVLLIHAISADWLTKHFDIRLEEGETAEAWLERNA